MYPASLEVSKTTLTRLLDDLKAVESHLQQVSQASTEDQALIQQLDTLNDTSTQANTQASAQLQVGLMCVMYVSFMCM